jgi:hypothetical protein
MALLLFSGSFPFTLVHRQADPGDGNVSVYSQFVNLPKRTESGDNRIVRFPPISAIKSTWRLQRQNQDQRIGRFRARLGAIQRV